MSSVSESIVREYFELHGFLVRQQRKYVSPSRRDDEEIDFFVLNPGPEEVEKPLPFVLTAAELPRVRQAVVAVKGWHTETFSPAVLSHAPEIFRFVEPGIFRQATRALNTDKPVTKILVVPALPQALEAREQSIELLRGKGVDAVILFRMILGDLVAKIETNRNYQKSDVLQVIRLLKNYEFFKEPQLELFKPVRPRKPRVARSPKPAKPIESSD